VRIGERVTGTLEAGDPVLPGHGPAKRFLFVPESAGPVTIAVESFDFDAFLRVETEAGELVAEADGGGVETNARIVLAAEAGKRYRLVAAASREGGGEFSISLAAGVPSRSSGADLLDAAILFSRSAAERALGRGDKRAAFSHLIDRTARDQPPLPSGVGPTVRVALTW